MARDRFTDYMQNHHFHLLDVSTSLPPVFLPVYGFATITAPEMTAETADVAECIGYFPRKLIKGGSFNTITLTRGSRAYDGEFHNWVVSCITGKGSYSRRKNLMLVHLLEADMTKNRALGLGGVTLGASVAVQAGITAGISGGVLAGIATASVVTAQMLLVSSGILSRGAGDPDLIGRPPGKIWFLYNCLATRVKVASDFDANSADVSMMELELAYEYFEQFEFDPAIALGRFAVGALGG